jgi:enoyl-[acyl-carrier protein] reductase II
LNYKNSVVNAGDNDTHLIAKNLGMARVIKNKFSLEMEKMENDCADIDLQREFMGKKREMRGIFEGNMDDGMIEAGQGSGSINDIPTVKDLMTSLILEYNNSINELNNF